MIGFHGHECPEEVCKFIHDHHIGFVILFSRNIESIEQVRALTAQIHKLGVEPPLIFTDQEGGVVVRFGEMAATAISPMGIAAAGKESYAETAGRIIGEDMNMLGIDGIFAPVLDVNIAEDNPVIGIRSFGDLPERVSAYGERFYRGVRSTGLLACAKHYPGHGAASVDSHLDIPEISIPPHHFKYYCLQPFRRLAEKGLEAMMTAHVRFPEIAPDIATFSPEIVGEMLRNDIGFNGAVFSDCLEMKAVRDHYSVDNIVRKTMAAGLDVMVPSHSLEFQKELLECLEFNLTHGIILESRIEESLARIRVLRRKRSKPLLNKSFNGMRKHIAVEQEMADHSITVLKNEDSLLPIDRREETLLIEWKRIISGPSIAENEQTSMVAAVAARNLQNSHTITLDAEGPGRTDRLPAELEQRLASGQDKRVIALIYKLRGEAGEFRDHGVHRLLELRPDTILVSLESPYEIKQFPEAKAFVVSYGFRRVQLQALFRVLIGDLEAKGKLPVEIKGLYPRQFFLQRFH